MPIYCAAPLNKFITGNSVLIRKSPTKKREEELLMSPQFMAV